MDKCSLFMGVSLATCMVGYSLARSLLS